MAGNRTALNVPVPSESSTILTWRGGVVRTPPFAFSVVALGVSYQLILGVR